MAEFLEKMKVTLYFMRLDDKYWGVFLLGVFVLFYFGKKETKGLFWLTLVTGLICLCPLSAYGLTLLFPSLRDYYPLFHMIPAGVVICSAFVLLQEEWCRTKRERAFFLFGAFVLLFFAGEFSYTSPDSWNRDVSFLDGEEVQAYQLILDDMQKRETGEASLWGPCQLLADCRVYDASLRPVYGKDIAKEGAVYSDSLVTMYQGYSIYETGDKPAENMEEQVMAIANCLNVFPDVSCDYVVLLKPAAKVADWEQGAKEKAVADTATGTEDTGEDVTEAADEVDPELVQKVLKMDTVWIFEELGYVYVGETDSLQVFRRL